MSKTPKLRFKEFSGEWESKKFKDIVKINQGLQIAISERYTEDGENRLFYITNEFLKEGSEKKYFIENPSKSVICNESDILMTRTGNTGKVITGVSGAFHNNFFKISYDSNIHNKMFLYYTLTSFKLQKSIIRLAGTSTIPDLNHGDFYNIKISYPSIEEQEKIASFFSLIDDKISLQGEKVEALKDYKKGMMQKIFSRELRFKDDDGRDYPEWEEKKLNQLGDTYTGLSGKTKENFGIGDAKYVIYRNVFGNILAKEEELDLVEINKGEKQNKVIKGDLLFTTSSETPEEVGMISCWNYDIEDLYLNSFCFGYRLFNLEQYSPIFMAYLLRSEGYRRKISILGQGSTRYNISKTELMKMKVSVPNIEEQRKIVSLLLGLESNIEKNQEKLDSLKEYKKGLLQQMFI